MNANMYCDILKQSMIPSLRILGRRAVFQQDNDHCHAKEAKGKGDWPSMSPDLNHIEQSVGHPQTEGGGAQVLLRPLALGCHHGGVKEDSSGNL